MKDDRLKVYQDGFTVAVEKPKPRTTVAHIRNGCGPGHVYIGRPSKWGNPFVIGRDGNRDEVVAKYRAWIQTQPELLAAVGELRGKTLVCFCHPRLCHGGVLADLANAD